MDNNTLGIIISLASPLLTIVGVYVTFSNKLTRIETILDSVVSDISGIKTDLKDFSNTITRLETAFEYMKFSREFKKDIKPSKGTSK